MSLSHAEGLQENLFGDASFGGEEDGKAVVIPKCEEKKVSGLAEFLNQIDAARVIEPPFGFPMRLVSPAVVPR